MRLPALMTLMAGVPVSGQELISEAMSAVFGKNGVELKNLSTEELRFNVRSAIRKDTVVLVVLDGVSKDKCKDIEAGLYSSDKYLDYENDVKLATLLNSKYGTELAIPDLNMGVSSGEDSNVSADVEGIIEKYELRLTDKDMQIRNLMSRVAELQGIVEAGGYGEIVEDSGEKDEEIISLRSKISTLEKDKKLTEEQHQESVRRVEELERRWTSVKSEYEKQSAELSKEKETSSRKSSHIKDLEVKIESLEEGISLLESEKLGLTGAYDTLKEQLLSANKKVSAGTSGLESAKKEIELLRQQLKDVGETDRQIDGYKKALEEAKVEIQELKGKLSDSEAQSEGYQEDIEKLEEKVEGLEAKIKSLTERSEADAKDLIRLNTVKRELEEKIDLLEKSTSRNVEVEKMMKDLASARQDLAKLSGSIFSRIGRNALPGSSPSSTVVMGSLPPLKNVKFVFAGSTESRKGTYKHILNQISGQQGNFLLVDAVSESSVDYVFQVPSMVSGVMWFANGGGVVGCVSQTAFSNIKVLSMGTNFLNDSFLLTVDWASRLKELENSGYNVIVFCGDISNLVGRVLFESFSTLGETEVYAVGNAVSSRALVVNMRGLKNTEYVTVNLYNFDPKMERFHKLVVPLCKECRVLNRVRN